MLKGSPWWCCTSKEKKNKKKKNKKKKKMKKKKMKMKSIIAITDKKTSEGYSLNSYLVLLNSLISFTNILEYNFLNIFYNSQ